MLNTLPDLPAEFAAVYPYEQMPCWTFAGANTAFRDLQVFALDEPQYFDAALLDDGCTLGRYFAAVESIRVVSQFEGVKANASAPREQLRFVGHLMSDRRNRADPPGRSIVRHLESQGEKSFLRLLSAQDPSVVSFWRGLGFEVGAQVITEARPTTAPLILSVLLTRSPELRHR